MYYVLLRKHTAGFQPDQQQMHKNKANESLGDIM